MTKPTEIRPKTTREQQLVAHAALGHLLAADLPALNWDLSIYEPRKLSAQLDHSHSDTERRAIVAKWAHYLGVDVQEETFPAGKNYPTHTTVWAFGKVMGIEVKVWCHVTPPPPDDPAA